MTNTATRFTPELVDPRTLRFSGNIRELQKGEKYKTLKESIRDEGLLQAVLVVREEDGGLAIRVGQHRTAAVVDLGYETMWVNVLDATAVGDDGEIERIVQQYAENKWRIEITPEEDLGVIEQLTMFGLSVDDIAKQTKHDPARVAKARKVAQSPGARKRYLESQLSLAAAAALAEFEGDDQATRELEGYIRYHGSASSGFADKVRRVRNERAAAKALAEVAAPYAALGHPILDHEPWAYSADTYELDRIRTAADEPVTKEMIRPEHLAILFRPDEAYFDPETGDEVPYEQIDFGPHAEDCECEDCMQDYAREHGLADDDADDEDRDEEDGDWAAAPGPVPGDDEQGRSVVMRPVTELEPRPKWHLRYYCTDLDAYEFTTSGRKSKTDKSAQRKHTIAHNKAWREAEERRRDWLREFLSCPTEPTGAAAFVYNAFRQWGALFGDSKAGGMADKLLGIDTDNDTDHSAGYHGRSERTWLTEQTSTARLHVFNLAIALSGFEASAGIWCWKSPSGGFKYFLKFLVSQGYEPERIERIAAGEKIPLVAEAKPDGTSEKK